SYGGKSGPWHTLDLSHGDQWRILRRVALAAAYRLGKVSPDSEPGDLVAHQQHAPEFYQRRQKPVSRNQGIRQRLCPSRAQGFPARRRQARGSLGSTSRQDFLPKAVKWRP